MGRILSIDGGGTKLNAILTDESMNLLGRGTAGGVNPSQITPQVIERNVRECLDQVFAGERPEAPIQVYAVYVGEIDKFKRELESRVPVAGYTVFGEGLGGLLAGALTEEGFLALSGTGSDAIYIGPGGARAIGGRGPIAGDDGSGAWIGQTALRAVLRQRDGWGEETMLTPMLLRAWDAEEDDWQIVRVLHSSPAPYSKMASLTRMVGEAAGAGDRVALQIVREAGRLMGEQMACLMGRVGPLPDPLCITLCGGAWKTHPEMLAAFLDRVRRDHPQACARRALFEHVCAGPVKVLLERGCGREQVWKELSEKLPGYVVPHPED